MKYLTLLAAILILPLVTGCTSSQSATPTSIPAAAKPALAVGGCSLFPGNNVWNTPITNLPVDPNSNAYINSIGATRGLKADFGSGLWQGGPIGIPYVVVPQGQPKVNITFDYDDESDPGPYPIPPNAPIEGGSNSTSDRHVIVVEQGTCKLYETWSSYPQGNGTWHAGSGAVFDLTSNNLRPDKWTSADAAGLPVLPGLVRYDEVAAGVINHALRFTVQTTRNTYVWPARHQASSNTSPNVPPMGQRFRLKTGFNISGFSHDTQVILTALKTYGMIIADNGSNWFISGAPDPNWNNDVLTELGQVQGSNFEAVDESSLQLNVNSGQAGNLNPPTNLVATAVSTSQINLTWSDNSTAESGFYIERKTGPGGTFQVIASVSPNTSSYQDKNLPDDTTYSYQVRAYHTLWGNSAYTNLATDKTFLAIPAAPSKLFAWATSANQIKLQWLDNSHNEAGFIMERSPDGVNGWAQVGATTAANAITFQDSSLLADTAYYYRVKARNATGDSGYSNSANAITTLFTVTSPTDDGAGSDNTTLSYALQHATAGKTITFAQGAVVGVTINALSWTPTVPAGVAIVGSCGGNGPTVTITGAGLPLSTNGLVLSGNNIVIGLKLTHFPGIQVRAATSNNHVSCVAAVR